MTYNERRGPNVSQYLRDLNSINPQETTTEESFPVDDDLSLFTNTQFFDFDSGQNTDFHTEPTKGNGSVSESKGASTDVSAAPSSMGDMPNLDFMPSDFDFSDFSNTYPTPASGFVDGAPNFPRLQANPGVNPMYGTQIPPQQQGAYRTGNGHAGDKSEIEAVTAAATPAMNFDDGSRQAAEEDKRRRNTAASARFRIKKKQREQALEKSAKEMSEKVSSLESKVSQLETENKWLKNLLVEKNEGSDEISMLWKEFTKHATLRRKNGSANGNKSSAKED